MAPKKPSTIVTDQGRIERHIKPVLGRMAVTAVTREDIEEFLHAVANGKTAARIRTRPRGLANVRGGKGTATRTVGLLGAVFAYAVRQRMRNDNPVHGVTRFADGRKQRRLLPDEYEQLGNALRKAKEEGLSGTAIELTRFLAVSGWRRGEALRLKWTDVDISRRTAVLPDTKTGRSMRPLSAMACAIIQAMPRTGELIFPATIDDRVFSGFPRLFARIRQLGGLPADITPHTLRHSFASLAADMGYTEPTIAALIGHKGHSTTSRYTHAADAVLVKAADAIATETMTLLNEGLISNVACEVTSKV